MDCIQTSNKAVDLFGVGRHGFKAGDPGGGILATMLSPGWCNGVQQEIINVIVAAGLVPTGSDLTQLLQAIQLFSGGPGRVQPFARTTAPAGWLKANGTTIGNAGSGATQRANTDTLGLFAVLWENFDNATLPIQNSAGVASVRGTSAAADFAAGKRMPLPDLRGEFVRGLDDGRAVDAGRVLGSAQADANKAHGHSLTMDAVANHAHGLTMDAVGDHTHSTRVTNVGGAGSAGVVVQGTSGYTDTPGYIPPAGGHTPTGTVLGAGGHIPTGAANNAGGAEARPRNVALLYCISL